MIWIFIPRDMKTPKLDIKGFHFLLAKAHNSRLTVLTLFESSLTFL